MTKSLLFVVMCMMSTALVHACDGCGIAGNAGIGLLTNYKQNFVRLSYLDAQFETLAHHHNTFADRFQTIDITARYSIHRRIKLTAMLPYRINQRTLQQSKLQSSGLSDITVVGSVILWENVPISKRFGLYLEVGLGAHLPTGKYDKDILSHDLPTNFNTGKGAWGAIGQINALASNGTLGFTTNLSYQTNTDSKGGYRFGNQWSGKLSAFYQINVTEELKLIPLTGIAYEAIDTDYYASGYEVPETGGNMLLYDSSINIKFSQWQVGMQYAIPLSQQFANGTVGAKHKVACYISINF